MRFQKKKDKVWRNKRYITLVTQRFRCWENLLVQMLKHKSIIMIKKIKNTTGIDIYLRL